MSLNGQTILEKDSPDAFADHFKNKIENIIAETKVEEEYTMANEN